ncbi:unnamed protein product, partial [Fusarium graminearum]
NGVNVPRGRVATTPQQVTSAIDYLGVLKAQILAGGRGKGTFDNGLQGGVRKVNSSLNAQELAGRMLGHRLRTKQTLERGLVVNKVYVTEQVHPQLSYREAVSRLYTIFKAKDATLLEINPVVITKEGNLIWLDSKFSFDDAACFRQPELAKFRGEVLFIIIYDENFASQGIIRGPVVAEALIDALKEISKSKIPIVVRLEGTDSAEGRKILKGSGLPIYSISDFSEAVQKAVVLSRA